MDESTGNISNRLAPIGRKARTDHCWRGDKANRLKVPQQGNDGLGPRARTTINNPAL